MSFPSIIVLEDAVSIEYQESLKDILLGNNFPWYYCKDITNTFVDDSQLRPGFSHTFIMDNRAVSQYHTLVMPLIDEVCNRLNFKYRQIARAKTTLQVPLAEKLIGDGIDTIHVDNDYSHWVLLYYVKDSDGDTLLLDKTYTKELGFSPNLTEYSIEKRYTPKQGTVIFFDGSIYHTVEQPRKNTRCIINVNLFEEN